MSVRVIHNWQGGKKTRRGKAVLLHDPETVTIVSRDQIDAFLCARNRGERQEHLAWLRERGTLIHSRGRLQQKVRSESRAYVFKGRPEDVPRIRTRRLKAGWY